MTTATAGGPKRVVVTGGAGLVGMNLAARLEARRDLEVLFIDKHARNLSLLGTTFPRFHVLLADIAESGPWQEEIVKGDTLVVLHAQITSTRSDLFERNNVSATRRLAEVARDHGAAFVVHASSSVLHSRVEDDYVRTKRIQEGLIRTSGIAHCVLRPTLMYGWFDPKHLGWLSRFMSRVPIFPIPGNGGFIRQPLYVQDFCRIVEWCVDRQPEGMTYDLTGPDRITYLAMIKAIRETLGINRPLVRVPVPIFKALLRLYGSIRHNPPFTRDQLDSLTAGDEFIGVDIERTFGFAPTDFAAGIRETLTDARYGRVVVYDSENAG